MSTKTHKLYIRILPFLVLFIASAISNAVLGNREKEVIESYFQKEVENNREDKIEALEDFFGSLNSPLEGNAKTFVDVADRYGLDYKLLPAIACMESSCGRKLIEGSYNPFGWGIYGKNAIYFKSYDEAIETVAKGISEKYVARGLDTPEKIAPVYTPPNSTNWKNGVNFFIGKISAYEFTKNNFNSIALEA